MSKTVSTDDCWLWAGTNLNGTYGVLYTQGTHILAHRLLYENFVGPIPEGYEIDHLCKIPRCVNPDHLEPVTPAENIERKYGKNLCKRGHQFTPDNCYYSTSRTGLVERQCKKCKMNLTRIRRVKQKQFLLTFVNRITTDGHEVYYKKMPLQQYKEQLVAALSKPEGGES